MSDIKLPALRANPLEEIKNIYSLLQNAVLFHILVDDKEMAAYILKTQEKMKQETESMGKKVDVYEEKYGIKICDLEVSSAYLLSNQQSRGRSILIFKDKAKDITQISALERSIYMDDLTRFVRGIRSVFSPDAFNYASFCDVEEQLHTYVIPKYIDAKQYGEPFTLDGQEIVLSEEKYKEMAEKIRKAIK